MLLAIIGGSVGLLLAYFARTLLPRLLFNSWESVDLHVPFSWMIFLFTASITVFTGVLFIALPAMAGMRADINSSLTEVSGTSTRHRKAIIGRLLVAFHIALSTLLVAG